MLRWKLPTHITPAHFLFIIIKKIKNNKKKEKRRKKAESFILEQLINLYSYILFLYLPSTFICTATFIIKNGELVVAVLSLCQHITQVRIHTEMKLLLFYTMSHESWPTWSLPNSDDDHRKENVQDKYYMHACNVKGNWGIN